MSKNIELKFGLSNGNYITTGPIELPEGPQGPQGVAVDIPKIKLDTSDVKSHTDDSVELSKSGQLKLLGTIDMDTPLVLITVPLTPHFIPTIMFTVEASHIDSENAYFGVGFVDIPDEYIGGLHVAYFKVSTSSESTAIMELRKIPFEHKSLDDAFPYIVSSQSDLEPFISAGQIDKSIAFLDGYYSADTFTYLQVANDCKIVGFGNVTLHNIGFHGDNNMSNEICNIHFSCDSTMKNTEYFVRYFAKVDNVSAIITTNGSVSYFYGKAFRNCSNLSNCSVTIYHNSDSARTSDLRDYEDCANIVNCSSKFISTRGKWQGAGADPNDVLYTFYKCTYIANVSVNISITNDPSLTRYGSMAVGIFEDSKYISNTSVVKPTALPEGVSLMSRGATKYSNDTVDGIK